MSSKVKIAVTQDDIETGIKGDAYSCAIALAVRRTLKAPHVSVDGDTAEIFLRGPGVSCTSAYELPEACGAFVVAFDNGEAVTPFEFEMAELPYVL